MLQVPQFDFTTFNFVSPLQSTGDPGPDGGYAWTGPSQPLQHIALAVMGLGQILPIAAPAPNASWTLDFWGPALQCNDVDATKQDAIWTNIWNSYNGSSTGPYAFLSWVPWSEANSWTYYLNMTASGIDRDLPFFFNVTYQSQSCIGPSQASLSTDGPSSLFIAVLPETQNLEISTLSASGTETEYNGSVWENCPFIVTQNLSEPAHGCAPGKDAFTPELVYQDSTLLRCDLVNTSYSVEFSYLSGAMEIQIQPNMTGNSPIVNGSNNFIGPGLPPSANTSERANCSPFITDPLGNNNGTTCAFDADAVRLLSYQGIMAAFNQIVLGAIQNQGDSVGVNTTIMKTILAETNELAFIRDWDPTSSSMYSDLQSMITNSAGWAYPGLANSKLPDTRGDLKSTLEQLFQNFTISLLAEPYFQ